MDLSLRTLTSTTLWHNFLLISVSTNTDEKTKPAEKQGRKTAGLIEIAGLPRTVVIRLFYFSAKFLSDFTTVCYLTNNK